MTATPRVVALVEDYLDAQYEALVQGEHAIRDGRLEEVHPTRVACRRYRTVLRDMKDLFDPTTALVLEESLRWYAAQLGRVRDVQVGRRQIEDGLTQLPPEEVRGPVVDVLDRFLTGREQDAARAVLTALDSHRYEVMIGQLHRWHAQLPLREGPPRTQVTSYVKKARSRYQRRLDALDGRESHELNDGIRATVDGGGSDELVHDARKAAKRARYVAELAEPEVGSKARATIRRMTAAQDQLGGQQDDAVSRSLLLELMTEGLPPDLPRGLPPGPAGTDAVDPAITQDDGVRLTLAVLYSRLGLPR